MEQCSRCVQTGKKDDRPTDEFMGFTDGLGQSLVGRECGRDSKQPEEGEGLSCAQRNTKPNTT
jgi:hypothetical protein